MAAKLFLVKVSLLGMEPSPGSPEINDSVSEFGFSTLKVASVSTDGSTTGVPNAPLLPPMKNVAAHAFELGNRAVSNRAVEVTDATFVK